MVADFVGYHVGLGEIPRRAVTCLEVVEKTEVDIELLIRRAIKRTHCRRGQPAGRIDPPTEQYQCRIFVGFSLRLKDFAPGILGVGQNNRDKIGQLLFLRTETGTLLCRRAGRPAKKQRQYVDAQQFATEHRQCAHKKYHPTGFRANHGRQKAQQ